jgi:hypothetical protein
MKTHEMISHLHVSHDFKLVRCNTHCTEGSGCDPSSCVIDHHSDGCFILPLKFRLQTEAAILACDQMPDDKRQPLPASTVVDHRTAQSRKTAVRKLFEAESITPFDVDVKKSRPKAKGKAAASFPASVSLSPSAMSQLDLRRFLNHVFDLHPSAFSSHNMEPMFIDISDKGFSVKSLASASRADISACGGLSAVVVRLLQKEAAKWPKVIELAQCLASLSDAYPNTIPATMAAKMNENDFVVDDLLEFSVRDAADVGLKVTDAAWAQMRGSVQGWCAENRPPP